jgi:3-isopropylmalate dehydrogenase
MSRSVKLAVIPGDGIGPEVVAEALKVLDAVTATEPVTFELTHFSLGAARYLETGDVLTDEDLASITAHDAILLGAVGGVPGDPRLKNANIERGLLLKLRFSLDHYVNLRPSILFPGVASPLGDPGEVDFVVVREGTEGPYVGNGGSIRQGTAQEVANEVSVNTAYGVERVVRYAFETARNRARKRLTLVHKTNVLVFSGGLWQRIVTEVAAEYPDVAVDYLHVDAATIFLVTNPSRFDVIGLAASGNINPDPRLPSMFEPVHGSAPDIAGRQLADPTAAILSVALLLNHLGFTDAAGRVSAAVTADIIARSSTGIEAREPRSTSAVGDAIVAGLTDTPASTQGLS